MRPPRRDFKKAWKYFCSIPRNVSLWMQVSAAMRARDWPKAERRLEASFAGLGFPVPSRDAIPKMNVAAVAISYWMHNPERALEALEMTIDQLTTGRIRNLSEASYVARYCFEMAEFCAGRFPDDEAKFLEQATRAQQLVVPFALGRIREDFRSLFPLAGRPS